MRKPRSIWTWRRDFHNVPFRLIISRTPARERPVTSGKVVAPRRWTALERFELLARWREILDNLTLFGRGARRIAVSAGLVAAVASQCAQAGDVYGKVTLGGSPQSGKGLEFERKEGSAAGKVAVPIDQNANYRVFLEPGRFEATLITDARRCGPKPVDSLGAPLRSDLNFSRESCKQ